MALSQLSVRLHLETRCAHASRPLWQFQLPQRPILARRKIFARLRAAEIIHQTHAGWHLNEALAGCITGLEAHFKNAPLPTPKALLFKARSVFHPSSDVLK